MTETTFATLRASVEKLEKMLKQASLDAASAGEDEVSHDDLYLNIKEDEVRALQVAPGEVVITYCSFGKEYFDEIIVNKDTSEGSATDKEGEDIHFQIGSEVILNVERTLTYLGFASEGGTVELHFTGEEGERLPSHVRAEGALEAWVKLPGSESVISDVPHWLPFRFDTDDVYNSKGGNPAPVQVTTNVSKIDTIINAVEEDQDAEFYPIVVSEDEEFLINIGEESRSGVSGTLGAKDVQNPTDDRVENYYYDGFEEIFGVTSGKVQLQTAPGNNPMAVVQRGSDGRVIRHVNGAVSN